MLATDAAYETRVNRVIDFISGHLREDLPLARLAGVACFSPFHFHRIFQGITGETLNSYVRRVRIERAAQLMRASPRKRLIDIALETGFAGAAEFSRAFRDRFGMAPSSWDRRSALENSKICKAPAALPFYPLEDLRNWAATADLQVGVRRFDAFRFVYARLAGLAGPGRIMEAYQSLLDWLRGRGIETADVVFIGMSFDDPSVTDANSYRYDLGVAFPSGDEGGILSGILRSRGRNQAGVPMPQAEDCSRAGFSLRDFAAHDAVSLHCRGDIGHMARAWQYLYRVWLPESDCEPADIPAMEAFIKLPKEIGWETFDLETCIPVVRL